MQRAVTATAAFGIQMTPSDVEQYLETNVFPALKEALADMCLSQPENPLEWLAAHLLELVPRRSNKIEFTTSQVDTITVAQNIADESFMRDVFDRHADCNSKQGLSSAALMAALKEVQAPVVLSSASSEKDVLRRVDANLSGSVDFQECETHIWASAMCADSIFQGSCALLSCRTSWRCFWRMTAFRYQPRMLL